MNQFVESLKRLYIAGAVSEAKVMELYKNGKITYGDREYIFKK